MRWVAVVRVLFVVYCVEAGIIFTWLPWTRGWEQQIVALTGPALHQLVLHPFTRGAVSGFGLVHLVWAAHDVACWLARRVTYE